MMKPSLPFNEVPRLDHLRSLSILDTPREERFDRILRLAVRLFRVPMAAISLVDGDRQWFKSRIGLDAAETPRDISFCGHTILGEQAMVVNDAGQDIRFFDNPLVIGDPFVRFYAGFPLKLAGGHAVGVLCVMDTATRAMDAENLAALWDLACLAEKELGAERSPELYARVVNAESEARKALGAKRRFLSNITHDLRTPMNGVLGMCQLLMGGHTDTELKEGLQIIKDSSERFVTVIDDLLDFTNLEIGAAVGRSERFNPVEVLRMAVHPFKAECARKGVRLIVDLDAAIPNALIGDSGRLRQIVVNLVGNAVQFTQRGMVRLEAQWLAAAGENGQLLMRIKDTGPGIQPERLPEIFIGFSTKDGSPNGADGSGGLGLAITKKLIDSMNGSIQVISVPGKGSNFIVHVGLAAEPAITGRKDARTLPTGSPASPPLDWSVAPNGSAPVLLVEDCAVNLKVAKRMLEKMGLQVDTAVTGVEALNKVARRGYSAIFMDCQMPDMDGYEATRTIRGSMAPWSDLPIIALTAFASPEGREECLKAGMDDHIGKPVRFAELASVVNRYVRK